MNELLTIIESLKEKEEVDAVILTGSHGTNCKSYYEDLTSEEKSAIEDLSEWAKKAMSKVFDAQGFNYAWNEEEIGGQSVPHFHLHVVQRKVGDAGIYEYEPREFLYRPRSRAESPEQELQEVVDLLKSA